jgi:hypothetical protein
VKGRLEIIVSVRGKNLHGKEAVDEEMANALPPSYLETAVTR